MAGALLCGALSDRIFAQYSQPPQTIYGGGYTPANAAAGAADAIQLSNQSDQQLFAEARLFEQQGLSAQAQRIYLELQRRSLIRLQSSQANHAPPRGYSSYGSTAPNGMPPQSSWTPTTGQPSGAIPNQIAFQPFSSPQQQFQAAPQSAAAWNSSNANSQQVFSENSSPQGAAVATQTRWSNAPVSFGSSQFGSTQWGSTQPSQMAPTSTPQAPVMVLDRQLTPAAPQVEPTTTGWRAAVTPLPAALAPEQPVAHHATKQADVSTVDEPIELKIETDKPAQAVTPTTTTQPTSMQSGVTQSSIATANPVQPPVATESSITPLHPLELARRTASDPTNELPNIPVQPLPDMPSLSPGASTKEPLPRLAREPAAFVPTAAATERPLPPPAPPAEPAGVVSLPAAPPTLQLSPQAAPRAVPLQVERDSLNSDLDTAARLAKQTDDIRIIPGAGSRGVGRSRFEDLAGTGSSKDSAASDAPFDPPTAGWKSYTPTAPAVLNQDASSLVETDGARRQLISDSPAPQRQRRDDSSPDSSEASESRRSKADERPAEPRPAFDLATLIQDPEFREIHTRPVLDALELLSQAEPRHRMLGALRMSACGPEARTALPALRQLLGNEANQAVRLRVAEAILKLQATDRAALDVLSRFLVDANDAELRQAAAGALGSAATSNNLTAVVRLTDALDDPSPKVRIMAALSLAQFGSAAVDAVPRLEMAATNDVPRMQRAALAALGSIRGRHVFRDSGIGASTVVESPVPTVMPSPPANQIAAPTPASAEAIIPRAPVVDQGATQNPAITRAMIFPAVPLVSPPPSNLEPKAAVADGSGAPLLGPTIPTRGISLDEIESDGPSPESSSQHPPEPVQLPEVPARPIERSSEKAILRLADEPATAQVAVEPPKLAAPRPRTESPKPANPQPTAEPPKPMTLRPAAEPFTLRPTAEAAPKPVPVRPAAEPAKRAAPQPPPLTDDSPLNLESQPGAAKPGSTQ
jgi:hypothetical protein